MLFKNRFKNTMRHVWDVVYPPCCLACGDLVQENGTICAECWGGINFIADPQCEICGLPFEFAATDGNLCGACLQQLPVFSKARAVFSYDDVSRKIITSFKYSDKIEPQAVYAKWMARVGKEMLEEADIIMPVPLHRVKLLLRKYNQAALLAKELARISGKKIMVSALLRKKHTKAQAGFSRQNRLKNITGAFVINKKYLDKIAGKKILLIDDVMTTGATVTECSKILLKAKVARVEVLTLAKRG